MEKEVEIYYFNDRKTDAYVCVGTLKDGVILKPAEGRKFVLTLKDNAIPWVKVWETNTVLISSMTTV